MSRQNSRSGVELEYIAFGEVLFEEHQGSFKTPYLFNGKELDRETNLSYYSARYLDMKTSLWLSVDAESENDLSVGSYVYAFNNPINFNDPDGNWPNPFSNLTNKAKQLARNYAINYVANKIVQVANGVRNTVSQKVDAVKVAISNVVSDIVNYEGGGYMLSNGSGGSSGDQGMIRKGGRSDIDMVDASGLVQAGSFATSKRDGIKYNGSLKMAAKLTKETLKGFKTGNKIGDKINDANEGVSSTTSVNDSGNDMITMTLEKYSATGTVGWNNSTLNKQTKDTTVTSTQKPIIDDLNGRSKSRATQQMNKNNRELQKKIDYYKE